MNTETKNIGSLINFLDYKTIDFTKFKKLFNNNDFNDETVDKLHLSLKYKENFYILKYKKEHLNVSNKENLGIFRSVLFDKYDLISFSPIKSIEEDEFFKKVNLYDCNAEELVEGTMINCFFNKHSNMWELTTKTIVGAETSFTKGGNTFKSMFEEAFQKHNLTWDVFNSDYIYSFVLQHPENKIVNIIGEPTLYLVDVFCVSNTIDTTHVHYVDFRHHIATSKITDYVNTPKQIDIKDKDMANIKRFYCSNNSSYSTMGIVFKHGFYRYKLRNPSYEYLKKLKGNSPKLQYQYLSLRKEGKVKEFLRYFPNYKESFTVFRNQLHNATATLWKNYISCYVRHDAHLRDYGYQYRPHMISLHNDYLNKYLPEKRCISRHVVISYINTLETPRLMHLINYNIMSRNIDLSKENYKLNQKRETNKC